MKFTLGLRKRQSVKNMASHLARFMMWDDYMEDYVPAAWCPVFGKLGLTGGR